MIIQFTNDDLDRLARQIVTEACETATEVLNLKPGTPITAAQMSQFLAVLTLTMTYLDVCMQDNLRGFSRTIQDVRSLIAANADALTKKPETNDARPEPPVPSELQEGRLPGGTPSPDDPHRGGGEDASEREGGRGDQGPHPLP